MMKMLSYKLRLLDLAGIGVFFLVLAMAFFLLLRKASYVTVVLKVTQESNSEKAVQSQWYLDKIKSGLTQKGVTGKADVTVLDVVSQYSTQNLRSYFITLKLLASYDKKNNNYIYQGVPVYTGSYQTIRVNEVQIEGEVVRVGEMAEQAQLKKFLVDVYVDPVLVPNQDPNLGETFTDGVYDYLAKKFVKGLVVIDGNNKEVAVVKEVVFEPSVRKFNSGDRLVEVVDRDRKKVRMKIEMVGEKYGDVYLFRQLTPIKINNVVYLDFPDFGSNAVITDFKEI